MLKRFVFLAILTAFFHTAWADVLFVADEFPAMRFVAEKLKSEEGVGSKIVWQTNLPPSLRDFQAVVVYIHKDLSPNAEKAFIDYARNGGKLVLLHHSISSGKRKNKDWFFFLGVSLPEGDVSKGGYKWIEGVEWDLVNIAPAHFITKHRVSFPMEIDYTHGKTPGFHLAESEVYLNHVHTEPRTLLLGLKYLEPKSGKIYMQDRAGWVKPAGKGWIVYLMPGHTQQDFENSAYGRIVINAIVWNP